jgi:hypothetical protein
MVLLLTVFAACSASSDADVDNQNTADTTQSEKTDESTEEINETTAQTIKAPDLPVKDYGGIEVRFLVKEEANDNGLGWTSEDIMVDEINGEPINDARYQRNSVIQEKYNITLAETRMLMGGQGSGTMLKGIGNIILSGDSTYDIMMPTLEDTAKISAQKYLIDWNTLDYINPDNPWWAEFVNKNVTINDKIYFSTGDITLSSMQASYVMLFHKGIAESYSIPDLYALTSDGKLTVDKTLEYSKLFASDLDNDGIIGQTDNIGVYVIFNTAQALYASSGQKMVNINDDGFSLNIGSEASLNVYNKIFELYSDDGTWGYVGGNVTNGGEKVVADECLFLLGTMKNITRLRNMETDFGVLPFPKMTEQQDNYYTYLQTWASSAVGIPITARDPEMSSIILEDMAYLAKLNITPEYYETTIKTKYARDEETLEMLDIIFSNVTCDLGYLFSIGGYVSSFDNALNGLKDNFVSIYTTGESRALTEIDDIYNLYYGE